MTSVSKRRSIWVIVAVLIVLTIGRVVVASVYPSPPRLSTASTRLGTPVASSQHVLRRLPGFPKSAVLWEYALSTGSTCTQLTVYSLADTRGGGMSGCGSAQSKAPMLRTWHLEIGSSSSVGGYQAVFGRVDGQVAKVRVIWPDGHHRDDVIRGTAYVFRNARGMNRIQAFDRSGKLISDNVYAGAGSPPVRPPAGDPIKVILSPSPTQ